MTARDWAERASDRGMYQESGFCLGVALALGYSDRIGEGRAYPDAWESMFEQMADAGAQFWLANWWNNYVASDGERAESREVARIAGRRLDNLRAEYVALMQAGVES